MSRKRERDKPYLTRHHETLHHRHPFPKRRRPHLTTTNDEETTTTTTSKPQPPPAVVVMGLPQDCSVLDLKSRFEIYGSISRIRINGDGVGHVSFRSREAAESAISASLDASFGITIDSKKVQVLWATDPLALWREGIGVGARKDVASVSSSKLLRGSPPLSKYGRGNKLASAIVNASSSVDKESSSTAREIVAYDDIL